MNLLYIDRPLVINPALAEKIGLNEAIVLQQMHYWLSKSNSGKEHEGRIWIYNTYEQWVEQFPFWSESTIKRAINSLKNKGLIKVKQLKKQAHDRTNYYTIDYGNADLIDSAKVARSTGPKWHDQRGQSGTLSTETTTETTTDIKKPMSSSTNIDHAAEKPDSKKWQTKAAKQLIDYLNQKTGRHYRHTTSNIRLVTARLDEGYTPNDVARVIERKCDEWLNDPQMSQYLRPSTLFNATKFNDYVGQIDTPLPEKRGGQSNGLAWDDTSWMEGMENDPF